MRWVERLWSWLWIWWWLGVWVWGWGLGLGLGVGLGVGSGLGWGYGLVVGVETEGIAGGGDTVQKVTMSRPTTPSQSFQPHTRHTTPGTPNQQVITVVKALVVDDVTVVATIHSPTAHTFAMFDRCVRAASLYIGVKSAAFRAALSLFSSLSCCWGAVVSSCSCCCRAWQHHKDQPSPSKTMNPTPQPPPSAPRQRDAADQGPCGLLWRQRPRHHRLRRRTADGGGDHAVQARTE